MAVWKTEILAILNELLGSPATPTETIILAVVVVLSGLIVLRITSGVFGLNLNAWWRVIVVFASTAAMALAAAAAVRLYLLDAESSTALRMGLPAGAAVISVLAIGIPLHLLLQKGTYIASLFCFVATIILTALLTTGVHTAYQAVVAGSAQMQHVSDRNKRIEAEADGAGK